MQRRATMMRKFAGDENALDLATKQFPAELVIFQKDSKTISIYNTLDKSVVHKTVDFQGNFPHNF